MRIPWALALLVAAGCGAGETGELHIRSLFQGAPVPARIEVLDEDGEAQAAADALTLHFECSSAPLPEWLRGPLSTSDRLFNRETGSEQFYSAGTATLSLPAGRYTVRAFKGIEYRIARAEVEVRPGEASRLDLALERWIDMPARGWWSVDDHVHITRRTPEDDERIATWMQAEDLHVANLLQMGTVDQLTVTPQHAFGAAGEYRRGDTLLVSGQEHPRTHFLGHTITLGADAPVDLRDTYIVYENTFRAAREANGVPGFAHWGVGPAQDGLAIDAPRGLVHFVEVLQFAWPHYDVWYGLLDLGFPIAPTAGTDFPCGPWSVPGGERFYVRSHGPPSRQAMRDAVVRGRTFVTNGPLLDLHVGGAGVGEELRLPSPRRVVVEGRVWFDPERDDPGRVELIRNGEIVHEGATPAGPGELRLELVTEIEASGWWALRVRGDKKGAVPVEPLPSGPVVDWFAVRIANFTEAVARQIEFHESRGWVRPSAAHTAAVWVQVASTPAGVDRQRAKPHAEEALARLAALEARLEDGPGGIDDQTIWDFLPYSDGVDAEHLRRNRDALLRAIAEARSHYRTILDSRP